MPRWKCGEPDRRSRRADFSLNSAGSPSSAAKGSPQIVEVDSVGFNVILSG